jgi:outer membrane protein insertion porin family
MAGDIEVPIDCYEVSGNTEKEAGDYKLTVTAKTMDSSGNPIKNNFTGSAEKDWKIKNRTFTALTGGQKCLVLMTRVEMGILGSYNRNKVSPFETFYVGGDGMSGYSYGYAEETIGLRGYENGSLSYSSAYESMMQGKTLNSYNAYAYDRFTLELRYPFMLGNTTIYGLGFLEGGNAWADVKNFNPFKMKRSAGLGVRIFLPMVGLMGIDWAYGFDNVFTDRNGSQKRGGSNFHFILGQEF